MARRIPPLEHFAILVTFIKLPFVIKIFVLTISEWPFYSCFTILTNVIIIILCTDFLRRM